MPFGFSGGAVWESLFKNGAPKFQGTFNSFCNQILARAFMSSVAQCEDSAATSSQIYAACTGAADGSRGCVACLGARSTLYGARASLNDAYLAATGHTAAEIDPIDCQLACKSCVAFDLRQDAVVRATTNCVNNTDFITRFKAQVDVAVAQDVSSKTDVFGSIIPGDSMEIRSSLSGTIQNTVTQQFVDRLIARVSAAQNLQLRGSSMLVRTTVQSINFKNAATMIAQSRSEVITYGAVQLAAAQQLLEENKTIDAMLKLLAAPITITVDMISSTMFLLTLLAIVAMLIAVVGGGLWMLTHQQQR